MAKAPAKVTKVENRLSEPREAGEHAPVEHAPSKHRPSGRHEASTGDARARP
jgi:hypothetical protein